MKERDRIIIINIPTTNVDKTLIALKKHNISAMVSSEGSTSEGETYSPDVKFVTGIMRASDFHRVSNEVKCYAAPAEGTNERIIEQRQLAPTPLISEQQTADMEANRRINLNGFKTGPYTPDLKKLSSQ